MSLSLAKRHLYSDYPDPQSLADFCLVAPVQLTEFAVPAVIFERIKRLAETEPEGRAYRVDNAVLSYLLHLGLTAHERQGAPLADPSEPSVEVGDNPPNPGERLAQ